MNLEHIKKIAQDEINEENLRAEIDKMKVKIRTYKPFWHKVFPFKIIILRR